MTGMRNRGINHSLGTNFTDRREAPKLDVPDQLVGHGQNVLLLTPKVRTILTKLIKNDPMISNDLRDLQRLAHALVVQNIKQIPPALNEGIVKTWLAKYLSDEC